MKIKKSGFGGSVSGEIQKKLCKDPIFLNMMYDSAIVGINYETGSALYSLAKLIRIEMEEMRKEGLLLCLQGENDLFNLLSRNFCNSFKNLQKRDDGTPPILLLDRKEKFKLVA